MFHYFRSVSKNFRVHLFLFLANFIYGISFTIAKFVVPEYVKPFGAIVIRVGVSMILFSFAHFLFVKEKIQRKDFLLLIACGLFGVAINQLMFFKGLSLTTPVHASLVMVTTPILVLVISIIFRDENFTWLKAVGIILGASGAATIVLVGNDFSLSGDKALGDLLIFINATSYAVYIVIVKPLMKKYKPLTVIKWVFIFGALFVFPIAFSDFSNIEWKNFTTNVWLSLSFIVIVTTYIAYLLNIMALRDAPPSVVGVYIYMQPVVAVLFALALGKDSFTVPDGISAALIFGGVYLVSFKAKEKNA